MHPYQGTTVRPRATQRKEHPSSRTEPGLVVRDEARPYLVCPDCTGRIDLSVTGRPWRVTGPGEVADRLAVQFRDLAREELHVLLLDTKCGVLDQVRVYQGNVSVAVVRVGELFRDAVHRHATGVILVHNHPSGDTAPSPDDLRLTAEAVAAGRLLDIPVLDHLIVGSDAFRSLRADGLLFDDLGRQR